MMRDYDRIVDAPQDQLGNYRLVRLLGRGGSATVYLGEHLYLKRLAAIKVLRTVLSPHERAWFLDEAKLLATLSHPQIVHVLEFAVTTRFVIGPDRLVAENVPFLIMDFVPGGNLRAFCPAGSTLSLDVVVRFMKQIASALQYAHDRGIIHRDIKPENLLLNEQQQVLLSDFGLALFAPSPEVLSLQDIAGTAPYAAPEQLRGKPVFASNQYALGIIAYEWLCGHRPFQGEDAEIILQHISAPPPRIRREKPSIPAAVEDVILKVLAKEPQQRFADVMAFAQKLEDASQKKSFGLTNRLRALDKDALRVAQSQSLLREKGSTAPFTSPRVMAVKPARSVALLSNEIDSDEKRDAGTISMKRNRQRMLRKVRSFWITGVLEQSLRHVSLIASQLQEAPDAVAKPWSLSLYQSEKHVRSFASGTSIREVYDQAQGELLILGEAGSGKTMLLLELARHLLDRAEQDEAHPVPVILTLSSWAEKQLPMDRWLTEELNSKYQVPVALAAQWVHDDMLLPLLDGLDEVAATVRSDCIAAINAYRQRHGPSPLVVCSRLTEYLLYPPRVLLQSAVIVQPLTMEQIERFLLDAGPELEGVFQALRHDQALQQLVTTPLMLNIIVSTYRGKSLQEVLVMRASHQRHHQIFSRYVEQLLRRHATTAYSPEQVRIWLSYLARHMKQHNQTIFYLDRLQPDWIDDHRARQLYAWLAVWLPGALMGALIGTLSIDFVFFIGGGVSLPFFEAIPGLVMGYLLCRRRSINGGLLSPPMETPPDAARGVKRPRQLSEHVTSGLFIALMVWLCFLLTLKMDMGNLILNQYSLFVALGLEQGISFGLSNGLIVGGAAILMSLFLQRSMKPKAERNNGSRSAALLEHLRNGLFLGLVTELSLELTLLPSSQSLASVILFYLGNGLTFGLEIGMFGVLISFLLADHDGRIRFADIVSWSWQRLRKSLCNWHRMTTGLLIGLLVTAMNAMNAVLQANWAYIVSTAFTGIFVAGGYCFIRAVQAAISNRDVDARSRTHSNEGAWHSLRYGLLGAGVGALAALITFISICLLSFVLMRETDAFPHHLFASIAQGLAQGWGISLQGVLLIAIVAGLLTFLLLGGLAYFQHVILRLCLWRTGSLPLSASRFLDYMTHCTLLQKVGSGYLFTHRLLFEYFLSLDDEQKW